VVLRPARDGEADPGDLAQLGVAGAVAVGQFEDGVLALAAHHYVEPGGQEVVRQEFKTGSEDPMPMESNGLHQVASMVVTGQCCFSTTAFSRVAWQHSAHLVSLMFQAIGSGGRMPVMAQDAERFRRRISKFNKVIIGLQKVGIAFGPQYLLTMPGRRSGQTRTAAVAVIPVAGQRLIFQAYPKAAWVANARAAQTAILSRGRRSEQVRLVELPVEERRPILRDHIANSPALVGKLFVSSGLVADGSPDSVAAAADRIAVFRIESA
jgi:hypothetical protein